MTPIQGLIVIFWLLIIVGTLIFAILYGRPWKYVDREMAWHLSWATIVAGLQAFGLLMAMWSLVPLAIADGLAVVIVYWRLALLIRIRRRGEVRATIQEPEE